MEDCLRVLGYSRYVALFNADSDHYVDNAIMPLFLRRRFVDMHRRQRLYGDNYEEWRKRDQFVANLLRQQDGTEVTPDEVARVRRKVLDLARQKAAELGLRLPVDDNAVLNLLKGNLDS